MNNFLEKFGDLIVDFFKSIKNIFIGPTIYDLENSIEIYNQSIKKAIENFDSTNGVPTVFELWIIREKLHGKKALFKHAIIEKGKGKDSTEYLFKIGEFKAEILYQENNNE